MKISYKHTDTEKDTQTDIQVETTTARHRRQTDNRETYGDVAGVDEVRAPDLRIDGEFDPSVVVCGG